MLFEKGEEFKKVSYEEFETLIETAAKSYISADDKLINSLKRGDKITIKVQDLIDSKYLNSKDLKNPQTYKEINTEESYVKVEYNNYVYTYTVKIVDTESQEE